VEKKKKLKRRSLLGVALGVMNELMVELNALVGAHQRHLDGSE
jgi:hypothetical protein